MGCGYQLMGGDGRASLVLGDVDDRSREPMFGAYLRESLAGYTFDRAGNLKGPDKRINVKVMEVVENFGAFDSRALPWEYQLTATADAEVLGPDKQSLWKGRGITSRQSYSVENSINQTVINKNRALKLLADKLAKEILRQNLASQYK